MLLSIFRRRPKAPGPSTDELPATVVVSRDDQPAPHIPERPPAPPPQPPEPASHRTDSSPADETIYETVSTGRPSVRGVLIGVKGRLEGQIYAIADGENKLGRHETATVVLPSQRISREHAMLVSRPDGSFTIAPLSDKNPTLVNGERTEGTELKDGDDCTLGDVTFRFRSVDPPETDRT